MDHGKAQDLIQQLRTAYVNSRLSHALMFTYPDANSVSSETFIFDFIKDLLCLNPLKNQESCKTCDSCRLWENSQHPDAHKIEALSETNGFSVEQIREVSKIFQLHKSLSPLRILWIKDAEQLSASNSAAANSLLKILEEPRADSFLFLSSTKPLQVLATIRSRCQFIRIPQQVQDFQNPYKGAKEQFLHWNSLAQFLTQNELNIPPLKLLPDEEFFWKNRDSALLELQDVRKYLWQYCLENFPESIEKQRYILNFFEAWDALQIRLKSYTQAQLQWLNFRTQIKI